MSSVDGLERALNESFEFSVKAMIALATGVAWAWNLMPADWPWWVRGLVLLLAPPVAARLLGGLFRRLLDMIRGVPAIFGAARFAPLRELRRAGMLKAGGRYLGQVKGQDVFVHGEGHCLTVAAQGSGKTTGLIIPTLITYRTGSVIVTDPKGAITAQTRRLREGAGRVVVLSPWRDELKNDPAFGLDLGDDGFNPLQVIDMTPEGRSAAATLAGLLLPDMPGEESYWRQEARELLEWGMLFQATHYPPAMRTLPALRSMLYDAAGLVDGMKELAEGEPRTGVQGALQATASKFYGMAAMGAGSQLAGAQGTATTALKIYADGSRLADHVSTAKGFRLADLKGETPVTLYLICPPGHLVSDDRKWMNLVLALIMQEIGKPGRARETVLLMDEFPALGYLPNLLPSLEQFREAGLRGHLIAQNPGQVIQVYGQDGLRRLWGVAEYKQFFRITDPEQARLLSDWLGQRTVRTENRSARGETSTGLAGVPLIRPEELTGMKRGRQIIVRPEGRPSEGQVMPYYKRRGWRGVVGLNPYRQG